MKKPKELDEETKRKIMLVHQIKDLLFQELAEKADWKKVHKTTREIDKIVCTHLKGKHKNGTIALAYQFLAEELLCNMLSKIEIEPINPMKIHKMSGRIQ
jgi:hypothetical protein